MTVEDQAKALSARCQSLSDTASKTLSWVETARHYSPMIDQNATSIEMEARRVQNAATRLGRAAGRRMCVGVFGASQAGKSYLVNSLARGEERSFRVRLGDRDYDFLRQINPQNETESTGLVSRFSTQHIPRNPAYPVALRLLGETDLVKILINSCREDVDHEKCQDFDLPEASAVRMAFEKAGHKAGPVQLYRPDVKAIYDLREYVQDHYAKSYQGISASGYWEELASLSQKLSLPDRATIYSLLWGENEGFTDLFMTLADASRTLGYASEACCGIDALLQQGSGDGGPDRHKRSILNVKTLFQMGTDADDLLEVLPSVHGATKAPVQLPRSLVTALTAELQLGLGDHCYGFFENADLLDFPGVRGRLGADSFESGSTSVDSKGKSEEVNPGANFFLRGKVEILFQRYEAERELTAMLLCVAHSTQEVVVLAKMVKSWIDRTLGATAPARATNPNTLFYIMTKFDNEFTETEGQDENSQRVRFDGRISEGLFKLFGQFTWPSDWDGKPFQNSFWLRNPSFFSGLLRIAENKREIGIAEENKNRIATLRRYCVEGTLVQKHMTDPERAFDEAMRENDGGVSYLVENLTQICQPDLKILQIAARLTDEQKKLDKLLRRYHDDAGGVDRSERGEEAKRLMGRLRHCIAHGRFGELLSRLTLSVDDIQPIHAAIGALLEPDQRAPDEEPEHLETDDSMDDIFGGIGGITESPAPEKIQRAGPGNDRAARFSGNVLQAWNDEIYRIAASDVASQRLHVKNADLEAIAQELSKAAERADLRDRIAAAVRAETSYATAQWDIVGPRAIAIAHRILSNFVTWLEQDQLSENQRAKLDNTNKSVFVPPDQIPIGDLPDLPETESDRLTLTSYYIRDWVRSYRELAVDNAGFSGGGVLRVEDNDQLGIILRDISEGQTA